MDAEKATGVSCRENISELESESAEELADIVSITPPSLSAMKMWLRREEEGLPTTFVAANAWRRESRRENLDAESGDASGGGAGRQKADSAARATRVKELDDDDDDDEDDDDDDGNVVNERVTEGCRVGEPERTIRRSLSTLPDRAQYIRMSPLLSAR